MAPIRSGEATLSNENTTLTGERASTDQDSINHGHRSFPNHPVMSGAAVFSTMAHNMDGVVSTTLATFRFLLAMLELGEEL